MSYTSVLHTLHQLTYICPISPHYFQIFKLYQLLQALRNKHNYRSYSGCKNFQAYGQNVSDINSWKALTILEKVLSFTNPRNLKIPTWFASILQIHIRDSKNKQWHPSQKVKWSRRIGKSISNEVLLIDSHSQGWKSRNCTWITLRPPPYLCRIGLHQKLTSWS